MKWSLRTYMLTKKIESIKIRVPCIFTRRDCYPQRKYRNYFYLVQIKIDNYFMQLYHT
nr:MAG TPA: hypothetical protein [Caudoviricetes sp.]